MVVYYIKGLFAQTILASLTSTEMFLNAEAFNQDVSGWNVGRVKDMTRMFNDAAVFQKNLCNWNIAITNPNLVANMFEDTLCVSQADPDLTLNRISPLCALCPAP